MGVPGSALGSARVSRSLPSRIPSWAQLLYEFLIQLHQAQSSPCLLAGLLLYSPESVDYFGTALLEFAMMNCGQTREEQCAG
jgi:hypothetical protein